VQLRLRHPRTPGGHLSMPFWPEFVWGHDDVQDVEHKVYVRVGGWLLEVGWEHNPCIDRDEYLIRLTRL
jgi:hypothetical protein